MALDSVAVINTLVQMLSNAAVACPNQMDQVRVAISLKNSIVGSLRKASIPADFFLGLVP